MVVQARWMATRLWHISSNSLICPLDMTSKFQLIITSPICLSLATLHAQRKSLIWLGLILNPLWFHSIAIYSLPITGVLRLMNLNMSMILTPRCVALVLGLKKIKTSLMHRRNFYFGIEIWYLYASYIGYLLMPTVIKPKFASTLNCPVQNVHIVNLSMPRNLIPKLYDDVSFTKVFWPWTSNKQVTLSQRINILSVLLVDC